jgi:hypothetical protein
VWRKTNKQTKEVIEPKERKIEKTYNDKLISNHVKNIYGSCKYMAFLQLTHCVSHLEFENNTKNFNF